MSVQIVSEADRQQDTSGLAVLDDAILRTITYRDLFDYPVTVTEIHRYLHGVRCERDAVADALQNSEYLRAIVASDGEYFALQDRSALFALRREREAHAAALWPRALSYTKQLAKLPFVRMVAVTGSLSVNNPGRDADIDFMLVTEGGRVWTTRMLAKVLQMLDRKFANAELCVNHLVSTSALPLEGRNLYTAQELTQMVPLFGLTVYEEFRNQNQWVLDYLPNSAGMPGIAGVVSENQMPARRVAERLLQSPVGTAIERWECRRKLRKYNETEFLMGRATEFRAEVTGHRRDVRDIIENAFTDRLIAQTDPMRKLRILFGQAYHLRRDPKLWRSMQPFPPLGTLYAAAVARSLGHAVRVHDSMLASSIGDWAVALQMNRPDVVVLYEDNFNYLTKMCLASMRDAAIEMIRMARQHDAKVLVCSSDSADAPLPYLQAGAQYILVGEGEETLAEALRVMSGELDKPPQDIAGLAFLDESGELQMTARRPVIRRIENLPLPAWDLIDLRRYREIWTRRHGRFSLNLVTTRGCPYHCNWCAKPIWGQRYNARSPESVVAELNWLGTLSEFDHVWFMDDIFGLKPNWIARFADLLDAARMKIRFKCLSRPDLLLRQGEIQALRKAGCDIVWMGAESGSQAVLDAMEKGTRVEDILTACRMLREQGIRIGLFIQFGYPGETRSDIKKTLGLIRTVMPDELGISVSYPLPGTPFYDRVKAELGNTRHWRDSDDLAMLFKGRYCTAYYRALHRYVHGDFGARRAWRSRRFVLLTYYLSRVVLFRTIMTLTCWFPSRGLRSLPTELSPEFAARPSEQPGE